MLDPPSIYIPNYVHITNGSSSCCRCAFYERYSEESRKKAEQKYIGAKLAWDTVFRTVRVYINPTHVSSLRLLQSSKPVRVTSDVPGFAVKRGDKNYVGPGSAKDLAER